MCQSMSNHVSISCPPPNQTTIPNPSLLAVLTDQWQKQHTHTCDQQHPIASHITQHTCIMSGSLMLACSPESTCKHKSPHSHSPYTVATRAHTRGTRNTLSGSSLISFSTQEGGTKCDQGHQQQHVPNLSPFPVTSRAWMSMSMCSCSTACTLVALAATHTTTNHLDPCLPRTSS